MVVGPKRGRPRTRHDPGPDLGIIMLNQIVEPDLEHLILSDRHGAIGFALRLMSTLDYHLLCVCVMLLFHLDFGFGTSSVGNQEAALVVDQLVSLEGVHVLVAHVE
eukprot:CAMPEP_0180272126 /NCGR_PEP_ID=MMETSP0988-20121125/4081_1 /TAXON_ID=697907 /ORGANISM="non described non described, Strain CCMP2293" /LENGTH=105 /DNA_ID=CAMNT_0022243181 /DNA_START=1122 /DNA_END=1439 /DNA_ORIENTATION=+